VWEWNEEIVSDSYRGIRGGDWGDLASSLAASPPYNDDPTNESTVVGFRVASLAPAPEPDAGLLGMTAVLCLAATRRCRANKSNPAPTDHRKNRRGLRGR
jgi:hypothetical protein